MKIIKIVFIIVCLLVMQKFAYAQNPSDYLILQNINNFTSDGKGKCGSGSGIIGGTDHFDEDNIVTTCETDYYSFQQKMAIEIQVEQHTGGDSDRWLLHEIEDSYRDGDNDDGKVGLLSGAGVKIRDINGNKIIYWGLGGGSYTWMNGQKVIEVKYTDLQRTKPEPIEVVKAYLAKFPSTITLTDADFKGNVHNVQWIKDEIDRRLWLCDKWNAQFQAGLTNQKDLIYNLSRSIGVFLNYRQKYYGVLATDDLAAMKGYMQNNDLTSIQTKLTAYKTWWNANKGNNISLP